MTLVRRLQRFSGRAVSQDVRLPADDLSSVGLVAEPLSERRFVPIRDNHGAGRDSRLRGRRH